MDRSDATASTRSTGSARSRRCGAASTPSWRSPSRSRCSPRTGRTTPTCASGSSPRRACCAASHDRGRAGPRRRHARGPAVLRHGLRHRRHARRPRIGPLLDRARRCGWPSESARAVAGAARRRGAAPRRQAQQPAGPRRRRRRTRRWSPTSAAPSGSPRPAASRSRPAPRPTCRPSRPAARPSTPAPTSTPSAPLTYELLAGRPPFDVGDLTELLTRTRTAGPARGPVARSARQRRPRAGVARSRSSPPTDRRPAAELADALEQVGRGRQAARRSARDAPATCRRRRLALALAAFVGVRRRRPRSGPWTRRCVRTSRR